MLKYTTTFLLASCSLSLLSSMAAADTPTITVGGTLGFQTGFTHQQEGFDTDTRNFGMRNDTEITIDAEQKTDAGWIYGAHIELEADVTQDARDEGENADKTFLYGEGTFGRIEAGNNEGAEQAMAVNAASIARATGGIDGDDEFYINSSGTLGDASFLIHPDLPTADNGGITEDATKISYYTPQFSGFQLGVSYTPDEGDGGQNVTRLDTNGDFENVIGAGLTYNRDYDSVAVSAGVVGERGDSELSGLKDLQAWQAGASITFSNISLAASYGDWSDSGRVIGDNDDTTFWTAGAAYEMGNAGVSATYFNSEHADNNYKSLVIGADYKLADGLTPYVETTFFKADEVGTSVDNEGNVVLVGTYVTF